jgi:hypothetical protein
MFGMCEGAQTRYRGGTLAADCFEQPLRHDAHRIPELLNATSQEGAQSSR